MAHVTAPCPHCHALIQVPEQNLNEPDFPEPEIVSHPCPQAKQLDLPLEELAPAKVVSAPPKAVAPSPRLKSKNTRRVPSAQRRKPKTLLILFVILCMVVVITYLSKSLLPHAPKQALPSATDMPIVSIPEPQPAAVEIAANETPPPEEAVQPEKIVQSLTSLQVLEKFLSLKNFEERSALIESGLSQTELENSILDESLPQVFSIEVDVCERRSSVQIVDTYYRVDFAKEGEIGNLQTILVRSRGASEPKVVVDPFLDLYGGKLASYAANPTSEVGVFQAIISTGAYCSEKIPDSKNKHTLKLFAREDASEIATAYFDKQSKIAAVLEDELSGLAYGQAKACKILLRWNQGSSTEMPFIEAISFEALHWNP
jgi:hypothetical protein